MDFIRQSLIGPISEFLWSYLLVYLLIGAGLYFTFRTRFIQIRLFPLMVRQLFHSGHADGGISSFQAFCVGLSTRVGTGNIAGVGIALTLGGPGAIFWMWVVAALGMATAFVEATLAQVFKVPAEDGSFRGGPAFYIARGLGARRVGALFAVVLIVTFTLFNMVQANTVSDVLRGGHSVGAQWTALVLIVFAAPVLFGGVRRIARAMAYLAPAMAAVYIILALAIIAMNLAEIPGVFSQILRSAFGLDPALAGTAGGLSAALLNGAKRGLFSNEAGMGSAPNAAATATTPHPARQGLIQSLGVFVDTMLVCTATALIIMVGGEEVYVPGQDSTLTGAALTQAAIASQFGTAATWLTTLLVTVFAYSSIVGSYSYAEVNLSLFHVGKVALTSFRLITLAAVGIGSILALDVVWELADVAMAVMTLINLLAIGLLGGWAFGLLRDFDRSRREGRDPVFTAEGNPDLPRPLDTEVW
ncbi:sodium:alanine symporter family protein [Streptomyces sp. SCSIO 30461]|uniref:alanine/glycine:cation symporter family protein n=1 Tax=Streptomyces sp. SCSIO 30461 TaxID=3118085 RepID=UPI0030D5FA6F